MQVTIVGAGALGRVYGLRLRALGDGVAFVVRPSRLAETAPFVIEQVGGAARRDVLEHPTRVAHVPAGTDVLLLTVRFEQIVGGAPGGDALVAHLKAAPLVPIVVLTPLLPHQREALEAALGRHVTPAMPSIAGYLDDRGTVRYWLTSLASTTLDVGPPGSPRAPLEALATHLCAAGIDTYLARSVGEKNAATTTSFFPFIAGIHAGGGLDGLLADGALLAIVRRAMGETTALAKRLGPIAPWSGLFPALLRPAALGPGLAVARAFAPETLHFLDEHFGDKLHDQHVTMGSAILALGREHGQTMPGLGELLQRIEARA